MVSAQRVETDGTGTSVQATIPLNLFRIVVRAERLRRSLNGDVSENLNQVDAEMLTEEDRDMFVALYSGELLADPRKFDEYRRRVQQTTTSRNYFAAYIAGVLQLQVTERELAMYHPK